MSLQYSIRITGDASGLRQATSEAENRLGHLGDTARKTGAEVDAATRPRSPGSSPSPSPGPVPSAPPGSPPLPPRPPAPSPAPSPSPSPSPSQGFRADQWRNLGFQANDVATSLASGAPFFQVMAQQGGQVLQVLQDGPGGVAGSLRTIGSRLAGLVTPSRLIFGGLAAGAAAAALATKSYVDQLDAVERSLYGRGRASGMTAGGINAAARGMAGVETGLTAGDGRSVLSTFARTGKIGPEVGGDLARVTRDYAFTTGKDLDTAAGTLAEVFADPGSKRAREFAEELGGVSSAALDMARKLAESGDRLGAQKTLLEASKSSLVSYREQMGFWAREWELFKTNGASAWETVGGAAAAFFNVDTLEQQLERAKALVGKPLGYYVDATNGIRSAQAEVARLTDLIEKANAASKDTAANLASLKLGDAIRASSPDFSAREALEGRVRALSAAKPEELARLSPELREEHARALDRETSAKRSLIDADEKALRAGELTIASIRARTAEEQALIASQQKLNELSGQSISASRRRQEATQAEAEVLERAKRASEDNLRAARDSLAGAGQRPYQRALTELEADNRRRMELAGPLGRGAEAETTRLKRAAIDKDMLGGPLDQSKLTLGEQIASLRLQRDSFYASAEQAGYLAEKQRLINEYTRVGVTDVAALMPGIDALAKRYGEAAGAAEQFQRTSQNVVGGMDELRSGGRGLVTGALSDLRQGKDVGAGIERSLSGVIDRMTERLLSKPVVESLLGFDGKAGGTPFADFMSKIFGDPTAIKLPTTTATPSMTVTAANVVVNGGIGGGGNLTTGSISGTGGTTQAAEASARTAASQGTQQALASAIGARSSARIGRPDLQESPSALTMPIPSIRPPGLGTSRQRYPAGYVEDMDGNVLSPGGPSAPSVPSHVTVREVIPGVTPGIDAMDPTLWNPSRLPVVPRDYSPPLGGAFGQDSGFMGKVPEFGKTLTQLDTTIQGGRDAVQGAFTATADGIGSSGQSLVDNILSVGSKLGGSGSGSGGGLFGSFFGRGGSAADSSPAEPMTDLTGGAYGGFASGGYTGPGEKDDPAGTVHKGEVVFSQDDVARHGGWRAVEDMRLAAGGLAGIRLPTGAIGGSAPTIVQPAANIVVNNNHAGAAVKVREVEDGRGGRRQEITIDEMQAAALSRPGSQSQQAIRSMGRLVRR